MTEEIKVTDAPKPEVEEKVEAAGDELFIDKRRAEIEKLVETENNTPTPSEVPVEIVPKKDEPKEPEVVEPDPLDKIKKSVQKRIDKVVAQKKSVEEELAEAKAELERLKSKPASEIAAPKDDTPPTIEQVEAYIVKMREEGNVKEEIAATRYLIKLEKETALKEVREEQSKVQAEAKAKADKQLADWTDLQRDYVVVDSSGKVDSKHDLNLANQNGLLYKTALALYNDKELHADFYNDQNVIMGFRRAVADAYREIHQQNLITPKGEQVVIEKRTPRLSLADPSAEAVEEQVQSKDMNSLSDAEKVRDEIKNRKNNRFIRKTS